MDMVVTVAFQVDIQWLCGQPTGHCTKDIRDVTVLDTGKG